MNFTKLLSTAVKNEKEAKKSLEKTPGLKTEFTKPAKRPDDKKPKGVQSAAVKAFLEKQEQEEKRKELEAKRKKIELMKARAEANHNKKAHAMASRTKDNLKVFDLSDATKTPEKTRTPLVTSPDEDYSKSDVLFLKNKPRVAKLSTEEILAKRAEILKAAEAKKAEIAVQKKPGEDLWNVESDSDGEGKTEIKCEVLTVKKDSSKVQNGHSKEKYGEKNKHRDKHKDKEGDHKNRDKHSDKHKDRHREHKHKHSHSSKDEHSRADKSKPDSGSLKSSSVNSEEKAKPKPKPKVVRRPQGPPPMSFEQLMALAQNNQGKPVSIEEELKQKVEKKKEEENKRPMTQEEKDREERRKSKSYQNWLKFGGKMPELPSGHEQKRQKSAARKGERDQSRKSLSTKSASDSSDLDLSSDEDTPSSKGSMPKSVPSNLPTKVTASGSRPQKTASPLSRSSETSSKATVSGSRLDEASAKMSVARSSDTSKPSGNPLMDKVQRHKEKMKHIEQERLKKLHEKDKKFPNVPSAKSSSPKPNSEQTKTLASTSKQNKTNSASHTKNGKSTSNVSEKRGEKYTEIHESIITCGKPIKSGNLGKRERPKDETQEHTNPWDRIYSKIKRDHPVPAKRRHIEDDEEESEYEEDDFIDNDYDDDMDDFIDDSEAMDYSKHIKEIFGYDKSKYRYERDDDIDNMEASYNEISREEAISAKLGLKEDLEDMRMEEEEKKRKAARKKKLLAEMKAKRR